MSQPADTPEVIRILIAEDHLIARVGVKTIINMQPGYDGGGRSGERRCRRWSYSASISPDITLMDMRMPGMSGWKPRRRSGLNIPTPAS